MLLRVWIVASLLLIGAVAVHAQTPSDRWRDTPTGYGYLYNATNQQVTDLVDSGQRLFNIERRSNGNHNVVSVSNSGTYNQPLPFFLFGQTATSLTNFLDAFGYRILDLEPYQNGSQENFSALVVPDSDVDGWAWQFRVSASQLNIWLTTSNPQLRLVDIEKYTFNGTPYYSAVAVNNSGANAQGFWYFYDRTAAQVTSLLQQNGARPIDIEVTTPPSGSTEAKFTVIMVADNPGNGWWYPELTAQQVADELTQNAARLTCISEYVNASCQTRYAVAMVDNLAGDESRRMRDWFNQRTDGRFGFKAKQVGGPVVSSLVENEIFETASTMKIIHAAYAIWQCSLGLDDLDNNVFVDDTCFENRNECPDTAPGACSPGLMSLRWVIERTLRDSNNNTTKELADRYGVNALNNFADNELQSPSANLNHTLRCLDLKNMNELTPRDGVHIYEQMALGNTFGRSWTDELFLNIIGDWGSNPINWLIDEEAALTNLNGLELNQFKSQFMSTGKAGGYDNISPTEERYWRARAGWFSIPSKADYPDTSIIRREYAAAAAYVDDASTAAMADIGIDEGYWELMRLPIREALQTWDDGCDDPQIAASPQPVTVVQGQTATFTVSLARGNGDTTFNWQSESAGNLTDIPGKIEGTDTDTLTIYDVQPGDEDRYRVVAFRDCGSDGSQYAQLTVNTGCLADTNGDGVLSPSDFTAWIAAFNANSPSCDQNNDGLCTPADFTAWIANYNAGC